VAYIAEIDGQPAGSGCVWFQPAQPRPGMAEIRTPYILSMYTAPEFRGLGVATKIVRRLVAFCRVRRYARVTLHASPQGRAVYRRLGFERTWEMRRSLRDPPAAAGRKS
jgi:GNAT superfamily N-acetyltransferase